MSADHDNVRIHNRALPADEVRDLHVFESPERASPGIEAQTVQVTLRFAGSGVEVYIREQLLLQSSHEKPESGLAR